MGVTVEDTLQNQIVKGIRRQYATTRGSCCVGIRLVNRTGLPSELRSWSRMSANSRTVVLKR